MSDYDLTYIANSNDLVKNVIYYKKIDSTNNIAKKLLSGADALSSNFLILSDSQTKGRGKGDTCFFSPARVGIYMSVVFVNSQYDLRILSIATSLAVSKAVSHFVGSSVKIKWPNDILINGKKVCGILIEAAAKSRSVGADYVIIGTGLNVNNMDFDSEIENIATSLKKESGNNIDRSIVIAKILSLLERLLLKSPTELLREYFINLEEKSFENMSECSEFSGFLKKGVIEIEG